MDQNQERHEATGIRAETEAEEEEGDEEDGDRDGEIPMKATVEVIRMLGSN